MNTAVKNTSGLASRFINGVLAIKPLANLAKHQARQMMIERAEKIGVNWTQEVRTLQTRDWTKDFAKVQNTQITYPDYYLQSFHAYDKGDLCWEAALEVEVAAQTVHATLWGNATAKGDALLRQSYHNIVARQLPKAPQAILDIGCSVGMSTFALQKNYPHAKITGLDLSPYFLAVAHYRSQQRNANIDWVHAAAESTGLPSASFDFISMFLICHELPQLATRQIFAEAKRLLRPGGHIGIMDMNPKSEVYQKMPPYVMTLLKSTEPLMDEYFSFNIEQALVDAGFETPTITPNSPRHRTVIAQVRG
ncbi:MULTISPECIES: class I SAM-dependent methyltransferase [Nostocales]|uniref:Class I SAM-dependent methyltransferase n=3 Tax=Nostocales TaxID=1161 RepID=A0A0C1QS67_9CYAN|nr:class I SAM-dependent methyltransferase [Tolypothrix bouteillei]KAF3885763.1 class I SAM-dependent methyltransferase [Tolypothrix bouteillei VB521301]